MKGNETVKKFIPKEKLGKEARKQLDSEQRTTWVFSPVTKKVESKKLYNRKRKSYDRYDDYGMGLSYGIIYGERCLFQVFPLMPGIMKNAPLPRYIRK